MSSELPTDSDSEGCCVLFQQNETVREEPSRETGGTATSGNCVVDCYSKFYTFLAVVCLLKFSGATGRASNFLVTVR